ncbi:MAG TPA: SCO family protein [Gammaproteobacteria bacterium]
MKHSGLSTPTLILATVILGLAALLAGLYVGTLSKGNQGDAITLTAGTLFPADFRALAEFELNDQTGQTFTRERLAGSWNLIFFGYTYCPDVCPLTLTIFKQIKAALAGEVRPQTSPLNFILVSVDPERDSPDRLKEYLDFFDPEFIGLTDTSTEQQQLNSLTRSLGAYYGKHEHEANEAYLVDHSAGIYLIDPQARAHALFSTPHRPDEIARDLLTIIENYKADDS